MATMHRSNFAPVLMSDPVFERLSALVRKSYPDACIVYIDRVVNLSLDARFDKYIEDTRMRGEDVTVRRDLFHGTTESAALCIAREGFKVSCNVTSAYGRGTYTAVTCATSVRYMRTGPSDLSYMFVCDGVIAPGTHTYSSALSGIYVFPHDDAVIPRYIIAFYKSVG